MPLRTHPSCSPGDASNSRNARGSGQDRPPARWPYPPPRLRRSPHPAPLRQRRPRGLRALRQLLHPRLAQCPSSSLPDHRLEARREPRLFRPNHRQTSCNRQPQLRRRLLRRPRRPPHPLRIRGQPHAGARHRTGRNHIPHPAALEVPARRVPLWPRPDAAWHHRHQGIRPRPLAAQHQHRRALPRLLARLRHPLGQHLLHPLRRSASLRCHPARQSLRRRRQTGRADARAHRRLPAAQSGRRDHRQHAQSSGPARHPSRAPQAAAMAGLHPRARHRRLPVSDLLKWWHPGLD